MILEAAIEVVMMSWLDLEFNLSRKDALGFAEVLSIVASCAYLLAISFVLYKSYSIHPGPHLMETLFKQKYSTFTESLNTNSRSALLFQFFFLARRVALVTVILYIRGNTFL